MAVEEYESMASYYDAVLEPFLWKMRREIVRVSRISEGMSVLEVACGTGAQGKRFERAGALYTGIDLSEAMLKAAEKRSLNCIHADGTALAMGDNSYDLSTISLALHEVDEEIRTGIVEEMIRVTKRSGSIVVADYTVSGKRSPYSYAADKIIAYIEKLVGGSHYRNYKKFMASGGLIPFMEHFGLEMVETRLMFGGTLGIVRLKNSA